MNEPQNTELRAYTAADLDDTLLARLADLYEQVYAEPPYNSGPLFSRARFLERTDRQIHRPGFNLHAAYDGDDLIGYTFGFTIAAGQWWSGQSTPEPEPALLDTDKFAVIELLVRKDHRGRGLSRTLMTTLLADRPEPYAMLLAEPDAPARAIYDHWGWRHITDLQPASDAPTMHVLIHTNRRASV